MNSPIIYLKLKYPRVALEKVNTLLDALYPFSFSLISFKGVSLQVKYGNGGENDNIHRVRQMRWK